jgi:hypothetical protein
MRNDTEIEKLHHFRFPKFLADGDVPSCGVASGESYNRTVVQQLLVQGLSAGLMSGPSFRGGQSANDRSPVIDSESDFAFENLAGRALACAVLSTQGFGELHFG